MATGWRRSPCRVASGESTSSTTTRTVSSTLARTSTGTGSREIKSLLVAQQDAKRVPVEPKAVDPDSLAVRYFRAAKTRNATIEQLQAARELLTAEYTALSEADRNGVEGRAFGLGACPGPPRTLRPRALTRSTEAGAGARLRRRVAACLTPSTGEATAFRSWSAVASSKTCVLGPGVGHDV